MQAEYLHNLNPAQIQAATSLDHSLLVLAGAGTGKTKVLTTRIAHILGEKRARHWEILAVTFTNKAAKEIQFRITSMLDQDEPLKWVGTFHSVAARILRYHATKIGMTSSFTILNDDDTQRLLKQILEAGGEDLKQTPPKILRNKIDSWKNKGLLPHQLGPDDNSDIYAGKAIEYYQIYQDKLKVLNAVDFGDLLLHNITIFRQFPEILADYHHRFKYILVDEYQDTNIVQYLWLRLLAQGNANICCVGDDDQSIYGWRGAEVGNILRFEKDFKNPQIIRLEHNYRSSQMILDAASALIDHNQDRLGKTLFSDDKEGEPIRLINFWNGNEEALFIADKLYEISIKKITPLSDIAILVRTSAQMRILEEHLIQNATPYKVIGGMKFYERAEIRDALAFLRLVAQPHDDLAFERICNKPKRGLGASTLKAVHQYANQTRTSLYIAIAAMLKKGMLKARPAKILSEFMEMIQNWMIIATDRPPHLLMEFILEDVGYFDMLKQDPSVENTGRSENLRELIRAMTDYPTLLEFLEHIALVMDTDSHIITEKVTLMTLHAAKGLEYHTVFLPGWEEGLFPSQRSMDENGQKGLEEERRLAYVALTRAKQKIYLSFAQNRRLYAGWQATVPSRFLSEIPKQCTQIIGS